MNLIVGWFNRRLVRHGLLIVRRPPSSKMLHEHANVSEAHHPAKRGNTVLWMREVADLVDAAVDNGGRKP